MAICGTIHDCKQAMMETRGVVSFSLLPKSQSVIDKYDVSHEVIREVIHEVIHVVATLKFTMFKQRSWSMKIDPGV